MTTSPIDGYTTPYDGVFAQPGVDRATRRNMTRERKGYVRCLQDLAKERDADQRLLTAAETILAILKGDVADDPALEPYRGQIGALEVAFYESFQRREAKDTAPREPEPPPTALTWFVVPYQGGNDLAAEALFLTARAARQRADTLVRFEGNDKAEVYEARLIDTVTSRAGEPEVPPEDREF